MRSFYFFILILVLGSILFPQRLNFSQDATADTPSDQKLYRETYQKMEEAFEALSYYFEDQLRACPAIYEDNFGSLYFTHPEVREKYHACKDLRKLACSKNQEELNRTRHQKEKEFIDLLDKHSQIRTTFNEKLSTLNPPNSLLTLDSQKAVSNHLQHLKKEGRLAMLDFFLQHYKKGLLFSDEIMPLLELNGYYLEKLKTRQQLTDDEEEDLRYSNNTPEQYYQKNYKILFKKLSDPELEDYIYRFIQIELNNLIQPTYHRLSLNEAFTQEVTKLLYPAPKKERIQNAFKKVQQDGLSFLQKLTTDHAISTDAAQNQIQSVTLLWPDEEQDRAEIFLFLDQISTEHNAIYSDRGNKITIYAPLLEQNEWQVLYTLGHEMAHSIDPWNKITSCFKQRSLGFKENQMAEAFSDWFAIELLMNEVQKLPTDAEKRKAILDSVIHCPLLKDHPEYVKNRFSQTIPNPHPHADARVNLLLRAHPLFNQLFNCPTSPPHCSP